MCVKDVFWPEENEEDMAGANRVRSLVNSAIIDTSRSRALGGRGSRGDCNSHEL